MTLAETLKARRATGRTPFIPFITAGDPSLAATEIFVDRLARAGSDIIELGVPFSDPVADGPVIQAASQRALGSRTTLAKTIAAVSRLRRRGETVRIILFTYLNPILAMGMGQFASLCARAGVDGVLCVDLPLEESHDLVRTLKRRGVEPVLLASPSTTNARLRGIGRASGSVVYYVSRKGVTGARKDVAGGITARVGAVKRLTGKAVIVGFGVSTPAQAKQLARGADGVVVGSALVAAAAGLSPKKAAARIYRFARRMTAGLEGTC